MSHDTWIHRAVRRLIRPLANTSVTPNHLTTVRLLTGLGAAAGFTVGTAEGVYSGAALFVVSMLFDRADGELARLSGKSSRFGHYYDIVTDGICDTAVLTGIGVGLRTGDFGAWAIAMGVTAGLSVAWIFYMIMSMERQHGAGSAMIAPTWGIDPDDSMLLIPLAMVFGFGEALLLASVILAPSAALIVFWEFRRRRRRVNAAIDEEKSHKAR